MSEDERVRAGVRGALVHLGERHGLSKAEQREFANEVDRQCGKLLASAGDKELFCDVVIEECEDRLEVHVGGADHTYADEINARKGDLRRAPAHPSGNGHFCTTLVKHFHKNPTHS